MPPAAVPVSPDTDGRTLVLQVGICLDDEVGAALVDAAIAATATGPERLDIDLCSLQTFTPGGAAALVACRRVATDLPDGLHYRTAKGAGRDALLEAYADHAASETV